MHDLNLTAMFADRIALVTAGLVVAQGTPAEVLTNQRLSEAYGCALAVNTVPAEGIWILPHAAA